MGRWKPSGKFAPRCLQPEDKSSQRLSHGHAHTGTRTHMCRHTQSYPRTSARWHASEHPDTLLTHRHNAPTRTRVRAHTRKTPSVCLRSAREQPSPEAVASSANRSCVPMILQAAPQLPHPQKSGEIRKDPFETHTSNFRLKQYFEKLGLSSQAQLEVILCYQAGGGW